MTFAQRMDIPKTDPAAYQPMYALEKYIHGGTLGEQLLSLVKLRSSQLNGCAYCLAMHSDEARAAGVDQRKVDVLAGWHEAPAVYTDRERAAIALTEEVTLIHDNGVTDEVWQQVTEQFSDKERAELLMAVSAINVWNRLAIATRMDLPEPKKASGQ